MRWWCERCRQAVAAGTATAALLDQRRLTTAQDRAIQSDRRRKARTTKDALPTASLLRRYGAQQRTRSVGMAPTSCLFSSFVTAYWSREQRQVASHCSSRCGPRCASTDRTWWDGPMKARMDSSHKRNVDLFSRVM